MQCPKSATLPHVCHIFPYVRENMVDIWDTMADIWETMADRWECHDFCTFGKMGKNGGHMGKNGGHMATFLITRTYGNLMDFDIWKNNGGHIGMSKFYYSHRMHTRESADPQISANRY
jgi:hypothetical protein